VRQVEEQKVELDLPVSWRLLYRKFKTNAWLWAGLSVALFIVAGFVDLAPGVKGPTNLWEPVEIFVRGQYYCSTGEIVGQIVLLAGIRAVPAIVLGWVLHAWVLAVISILKEPRSSVS